MEKKIMNRLALKEYKKGLCLTDVQSDVLVGTLLGDGTMSSQKGNALYNIKWEQRLLNKEYIDHIYLIFKDWIGTPPSVRFITGGGAKDRQSIWVKTYRHESLTYYRHLFYEQVEFEKVKYRKRVPANIVDLLNARVLAYWFMDDGHKKIDSNAYCISTNSFNLLEHELLVKALDEKLNLKARIHRDGEQYRLYFRVGSTALFTELVTPYILPCMQYKLL